MKTKAKALEKTAPRRDLGFFDEMDRVFDTMMGRAWPGHRRWMHPLRDLWPEWAEAEEAFEVAPRVDVIDRDEEILVRAELPGVERKDVEIDVVGQVLTLRGERQREEKEEEGAYFRAEIARGAFSRSIRLPEEVDLDQTKADFTDGVLQIHLPKTHKTERRRIALE